MEKNMKGKNKRKVKKEEYERKEEKDNVCNKIINITEN